MVVQHFPNDTGPVYAETLAGRFPVEPFNTLSNLVFLFILVYWGVRVYKQPGEHRFLAWCLPVLGIGWVGGTLFHATRSHEVWLLMDWVPILLLCFAAVVYFIFKLIKPVKYRLLVLAVFWPCLPECGGCPFLQGITSPSITLYRQRPCSPLLFGT